MRTILGIQLEKMSVHVSSNMSSGLRLQSECTKDVARKKQGYRNCLTRPSPSISGSSEENGVSPISFQKKQNDSCFDIERKMTYLRETRAAWLRVSNSILWRKLKGGWRVRA